MLYLAPGSGVPTRVHGAFVADHEVHQLVDSLKTMGEPDYLNEIIDGSSEPSVPIPGFETQDESSSESDPLYDQCVEFITTSRRVSISGLQRRFKIGFNRAARIIEDMEVAGIVSGAESGGSREVLAPAPIGD